ncbi:hypothetical protein SPRG_01925 [Saprolegnia parasitica CBS 223.65]|uniref:Uncharacterized protein n=1 Tax=Saprolegnia parasitica (strain CBS 223.65) TaxID=695850 RepID=A0A067CRI7_SAPPC|nr:hypothetical protein SPRG_01925 [Saprolegnia parasitica CBS 223.65]KDO33113.1 hypothetical protein SPRG_01925 [Saprolegnia parasitica CBS 223.65]|eukprot:XP_012195880.1 hypothetical protein SPRG_01925 [Saprolegnia parasitica CBS 223.65]
MEFDLLAAWGITIPSPRSSSASMASAKDGYRIIRPTLRPPLPSSVWRDANASAPTSTVPPTTRHSARLRRNGLCKRPDSMKGIVEQAVVCRLASGAETTTTVRDSLRVVRDRTLHKATTTTALAERLVIEDPECALKRRVHMQPPWPKAYLHAYLSAPPPSTDSRGLRPTVSATKPAPSGRPRAPEAVASSCSSVRSVCLQSCEPSTPLASRVAKTKEMLKVSRLLAKERLAC